MKEVVGKCRWKVVALAIESRRGDTSRWKMRFYVSRSTSEYY